MQHEFPTNLEVSVAKANLYQLLLRSDKELLSENEIELMFILSQDEQIRKIIADSKKK